MGAMNRMAGISQRAVDGLDVVGPFRDHDNRHCALVAQNLLLPENYLQFCLCLPARGSNEPY
jgi:hypothetical protein